MLELAIMIEEQDGLNRQRWQRIVRPVEDLGFAGLYRSDHNTNANPPDLDSLKCWVSLTWLGEQPAHRVWSARRANVFPPSNDDRAHGSAVDNLSGGHLTLGLGADWQEREHANYGCDWLDLRHRFQRFEEGVQIIEQLLMRDAPLTFDGEFYHIKDAVLLPRSQRRIPILIGSNDEKWTLLLVARYAGEWNATFQTPENSPRLNTRLNELLAEDEGEPRIVSRSMMTVSCQKTRPVLFLIALKHRS